MIGAPLIGPARRPGPRFVKSTAFFAAQESLELGRELVA